MQRVVDTANFDIPLFIAIKTLCLPIQTNNRSIQALLKIKFHFGFKIIQPSSVFENGMSVV